MKSTFNIKQYLRVGLISIGILSSYTSFVYSLGKHKQSEKTGIELKEIFSIRAFKLNNEEFNTTDNSVRLNNIYLATYPKDSTPNGISLYRIHKLDFSNPLAIRVVGTIDNQKIQLDPQPRIGDVFNDINDSVQNAIEEFSLTQKAHAQSTFSWNGYETNYNFYEEYLNKDTVRRYYQNGAILEYKISSQGVSIAASFKWIKRV
ncbi:hypothetical protein I4641_22270 [Waterburya agarophytonicola K14]|uniref:Uncharacterized protein n=1 Tax=Waterburya agarophytonicola KI4 TaxID=2874699 RepID=A0A964BV42_9CYAN|nr:hypothetical protein [Waterburya agarophytonicola]MCC0179679.1 hypothetical protein [Waterburya agarophytonicola KI4]